MSTFHFKQFKDKNTGFPYLDENQWNDMLSCIPDSKNRTTSLSQSILNSSNVSEPRTSRTEEQCKKRYVSLIERDFHDFMIPNTHCIMKHMDYAFNVGKILGVIQLGHSYNIISDFFQRDNRIRCPGYNRISPYSLWTGNGLTKEEHKTHLLKALSVLWRMKNKKRLGPTQYQECARLSGNVYTAAQFKVHVAKAVYDFFGADSVIDFSMGWGDRLAGWFSRSNPGLYIGCDPNPNTFRVYKRQIKKYLEWYPHKNKEVNIQCAAAEDIDWSKIPLVDLVFTSPPYFDTEMYGIGKRGVSKQSWHRYHSSDAWFNKFLKPVIERTSSRIMKGGHLAINIIDVEKTGLNRVRICDKMHEVCDGLGLSYKGILGMRMKQRPKTWKSDNEKQEYMKYNFIEPIWVWRKK